MGNFVRNLSARACLIAADNTWIEDAAVQQLITTSQLTGMRQVVGMPDLHPGRGYPVGAAFFSVGHYYPALVGNDIGCGMGLWQTDILTSSIKLDKLEKRFGNIDAPFGPGDALDGASMVDAACRNGQLVHTGYEAALGTLGGGNHFAELQKVAEIVDPQACQALGLNAKQLLLLVHSGSRGLGQHILRQQVDQFGHAGLAHGSAASADYFRQHENALQFAKLNRELIAKRICANLRSQGHRLLDVHHNYVCPANLHGEQGWLHRKGATPSDQGPVMVPGSRGDFSYLVQAERIDDHSLRSLAHGAGRKWIRSACKDRLVKLFSPTQLGRTTLGSRVICNDKQLIYEEAPQAYKSIDSVIHALHGAGLIKVLARMQPVLSYKTRGECCA